MPARDDHLHQARHNVKFHASIDKSAFRDWAATSLFYAALHYIDAFLADRRNIHPPKHKERDNLIATISELKPIFVSYAALKDGSFNARYNPGMASKFSDRYVAELESTHLARIKAEIGRYVSI
jgi:hypothetical protein